MANTVVVTRPPGTAEDLIRQLGDIPSWHEPVADVLQLSRARAELRELIKLPAQLYIATSQHAVRALAKFAPERDLPLYVIGKETAEKAQQLGFSRVNYSGGTARVMLDEIAHHYVPTERPMVFLSGRHVTLDIAALLRNVGFDAQRVTLYDVIRREQFSSAFLEKLAQGEIAVITLFSERMAQIFASLAASHGIEQAFANCTAVCLSPKIAQAARALPFAAVYAAEKPTLASLVKSVHHALHG